MTEKERLVKDRLLLDKERELLQRQASEIREEYQKMHEEHGQRDRKAATRSTKRAQHSVQDFIDPKDANGYSPLLRDAMSFCETRDGCPFLGDGCKHDEMNTCRGVWIRMGATCTAFAEKIKPRIKSENGHGK